MDRRGVKGADRREPLIEQPCEIESKDAPAFASSAAMRFAASTLLLEVKQCANRAKARTAPAGRSRYVH